MQLRFDGAPAGGPATLNCYVWPIVQTVDRLWRKQDLGYADAHLAKEEVYVEIAELMGFHDGSWMVWRPGEDSFEDLA